jgi:hypothetical protein
MAHCFERQPPATVRAPSPPPPHLPAAHRQIKSCVVLDGFGSHGAVPRGLTQITEPLSMSNLNEVKHFSFGETLSSTLHTALRHITRTD